MRLLALSSLLCVLLLCFSILSSEGKRHPAKISKSCCNLVPRSRLTTQKGIELLKPGSTQMRPSCPAVETPEALTCPLPTFMVAVSCDSELGGFTSDIQEHSKIPRPGSNGATNLQSHYEAHMSAWLHESESQRFLLWELQCQRFPSWPECRIARPQCDQPGLQHHGQPQTASNA